MSIRNIYLLFPYLFIYLHTLSGRMENKNWWCVTSDADHEAVGFAGFLWLSLAFSGFSCPAGLPVWQTVCLAGLYAVLPRPLSLASTAQLNILPSAARRIPLAPSCSITCYAGRQLHSSRHSGHYPTLASGLRLPESLGPLKPPKHRVPNSSLTSRNPATANTVSSSILIRPIHRAIHRPIHRAIHCFTAVSPHSENFHTSENSIKNLNFCFSP